VAILLNLVTSIWA